MKKLTSLLLAGLLLLTSCRTENVVDPVTGETSKKPVLSFKAEDSAGETDKEAEAETEEIVTRTTHLTGIFKKEIFPRHLMRELQCIPEILFQQDIFVIP